MDLTSAPTSAPTAALPSASTSAAGSPPRLQASLRYTAGELSLDLEFTLIAPRNVLFGRSGAGKTTLLRLLAGLLHPDQGAVTLDGRPLLDTMAGHSVTAGRRRIGYLTQAPALFPHLSVEENLAFGLRHLARPQRKARFTELLTLFSLEPLARRSPLRLSGGERQRVALARALAPQPTLLLLDEPFSGLDGQRKAETITAMEQYLARHPATVLTVSHDIAEAYAGDAEVLLLEGGRIAAQGPAGLVLKEQRQRLLAQLGCGTE